MIDQMRRATARFLAAALAALTLAGAAHGADADERSAEAPQPDSTILGEHNRKFFQNLRARNLSLGKSYESFLSGGDDDKAQTVPNFDPATFSLSRSPDDDGTPYATEFFLGWMPFGSKGPREPILGTQNWTLMLSAEGNISSEDTESIDAVRFRTTASGVYGFGGEEENGLIADASVKYEASRDFDTEKLIAEFQFRPQILDWGVGQRLELFGESEGVGGKLTRRAPVDLLWRPFFRVDVGETLDAPANAAEAEDTVLRLVGVVEGKLFFNKFANALGMYEVSLSATEKFHYLPLEDGRRNFNFFSTGVHFLPSPDVSINLTYDIGRDAPTFEKVEMLRLGVGLRF
jgi:hypothetical protein